MPITFDGPTRRIVLDASSVSAAELWSRWCDWLDADTNNGRWLPAFRQVGGDDLGGGLSIPPYLFLLVVQTLGNFNVSIQYTVPVQAQGISTSGSSGPTAAQVADEVMARLAATTIPVDVRKINAVAVEGSGVVGDEWGPA